MSLESKIGFILLTLAALYFAIHYWQGEKAVWDMAIPFMVVGTAGVAMFVRGLHKPETKSP